MNFLNALTQRRGTTLAGLFLLVAFVGLQGCASSGSGGGGNPPPPVRVTISPTTATVITGQSTTFSATVANALNTNVTWQVNGVTGGDATHGTITAAGMYTAPATVPATATVNVTAVSQADTTKFATAVVTIQAPPISVGITPGTANVQAGIGSQTFTATVQNDAQNKGVTWALSQNGTSCSPACGSLTGATATTVKFVAPANLPTSSSVTLTAVSVADTTKSGTAAITLTPPIAVGVSPGTASVNVGRTAQFSAVVSNDGANAGVTWALSQNGTSCAPSCGTINSSGLYTAPAAVPSPATVTATATSVSDTTRNGTAVVTVLPAISVSFTPTTLNVQVNKTQSFTATVQNDPLNEGVNWTLAQAGTACSPVCGTLLSATPSSVTYAAPASVPGNPAVTLTATSANDATKNFSTVITVVPPPAISVSVAPNTANIQAGIGTQNFAATLQNDTQNKGVTWALSGTGCSGASCGTLSNATTTSVTYTAPTSVPTGLVVLTGSSIADTSKQGTAQITVTPPVGIGVSPTTATLNVSKAQQFVATISNDAQNKGASWTLSGAGCSGAACGTLSAASSASGVAITYTAPAAVPSPAIVTLTAASIADPTRTAPATISLLPAVSVSVSPSPASVQVNLAQSFTAGVSNDPLNQGVTWTLAGTGCSGSACGTLSNSSSTGITYTAPAAIPTPATVTLTATSVTDSTAKFPVTITITPVPVIVVSISPVNPNVQAGIGAQNFTASLTNDTQNKGVTWSLSGTGCSGASCGTLTNVTTSSVTYNAPASPPSPNTVTITATSIADTSKNAPTTITVTPPVSVGIAPGTATLNITKTQQFTATVSNDAQNKGVTWTLSGAGCSGAACGTLSASSSASGAPITYTAPATVPSPASVTLTAVSVADSTRTAPATINLLPAIAVSIAPQNPSVQTGVGTQNFTATVSNDAQNKGVTWTLSGTGCSGGTCGTLTNVSTTSVTYNAPTSQPSPNSVTVTATSISDGSKSAPTTITLTPAVSVSVVPTSATLNVTKTQQFTATVSNDAQNKGVTWTLSGTGCSGGACGTISAASSASGAPITYTAPAVAPSPATVTLTAVSVTDPSRTFPVSIGLLPAIAVSIAPQNPSVQTGIGTQNFTATVSNDLSNQGVNWTLSGTGCSGATCGTLTNVTATSATYNAPTSQPSPDTVTITATSIADGSKNAPTIITLTPAISVGVAPTSATLNVTKTQQFTATVTNDAQNKGVTWTLSGTGCSGAACGTISASSSASGTPITYTAPGSVPSPASVTLTAASVADPSRTGPAAITLLPAISVSIAPQNPTVVVNTTKGFTATVSNDSQNAGVTWTLTQSGANCSPTCGTLTGATSTSVTYNAPASVPSPAAVTLTAKSVTDTSKTGTTTITVASSGGTISVAISPKAGGITIWQTQALTATVTNDIGAAGVIWSSSGGTLSNQTTTTATFGAAMAGSYTITATSIADGTKSATITLGVTDLTGVTTYMYDPTRLGQNAREFALTTANVNKTTFGKLFSCGVDAAVYGQPLWVPNLNIAGGTHNVIYVATQHDTVYAYDADSPACTNLWGGPVSLLLSGETWVTSTDVSCTDLQPNIGIVSTPVIDLSTNTIYVVTKTKMTTGAPFHQRLHALDLLTGAEKFSGPTEITATVAGTGSGSSGGFVSFDPLLNHQRAALLLTNGHVVIAWASHCDNGAYHGWVMSYSASTLLQEAVLNVTPNGTQGGIWMSGNGPSADASGNIYVPTGNGSWDGNKNFGDSVIRLSPPSGGTFLIADYFTPWNQSSLNLSDSDVASCGSMLLPDSAGVAGHPHLLVQSGKGGDIYLIDRDNMGKYCPNATPACSGANPQIVQDIPVALHGIWASPTYWNGNLYFGDDDETGNRHSTLQYTIGTTGPNYISTTPFATAPNTYTYPGPTSSISSNGSNTGVVWSMDNSDISATGHQVMYAYPANNIGSFLYNTTQAAGNRDAGSAGVKFTVATVANGKVYAAGQASITVYGLLP